MADHHIEVRTEDSEAQIPPLESYQNQNHQNPLKQGENEDDHLNKTLQWLETFLTILGFRQSSLLGGVLSWTGFLLVGVVLTLVVLEVTDCSGCEMYQIKSFERDIVASQACLAAISLLCLSNNLRKYGLRRFLFVDRQIGYLARFRNDYIKQFSDSLRLLVSWVIPCILLKTAREVARIVYADRDSWWLSVAILLSLVLSWTYVSLVSLSASTLFHLVCNLQVIHFADYGKLLEREPDVFVLIEEHVRLRYHLSKISHRFRIYLLLEFIVVTASLFVILLQITAYSEVVTLINGGDFAVSAIVQVVGSILCLHAATKISHRAQGIASVANQWHAVLTCSSDASQSRAGTVNSDTSNHPSSIDINYSESDLESLDYVTLPTNTQLVSFMLSYHRRQAFVLYLQTNPRGITIFGWTVDTALINTIFFIELTLITFLLGKTLVFTS